ncbi:hypothetical protein [Actinophytocola sp.]|uniref:hypothetical protein n=1 Tax=Actinophytocola sp. TaxID=1872138 RepID=UPI002ED58085
MRALMRATVAAAVLIGAVVGGAGAAAGTPSDPPGATVTVKAEVGAHPVNGRTAEWISPDSEIMVWEYQNVVKIDAMKGLDDIRVELNGPNRARLAVGTYQDVRNQLYGPASSPGILVISRGLGCIDDYAEFTVDRIERDLSGRLVALEASFTQRCGAPDGPALNGHVHYQA